MKFRNEEHFLEVADNWYQRCKNLYRLYHEEKDTVKKQKAFALASEMEKRVLFLKNVYLEKTQIRKTPNFPKGQSNNTN